MGSKAEYEAKKAAKLAKRAAEAAARQQAGVESGMAKDPQAPARSTREDRRIRYQERLAAETAAYQAAGLARLTVHTFMTKDDPLGETLLSQIFPEHLPAHTIGFCVTAEPGHIIAEQEPEADDENDDVVSFHIRDAVQLQVGEVVHACLYEPAGRSALRCIKRVLYPHVVLPDGWQTILSMEETFWAEEEAEYTETFGLPVGKLIYVS